MERWLSEPRLRRYLDACQGDFARAMELYEWNLDLGAVLMKDIAYFEVALRNSYDRAMHERYGEDGHWLFDECSPVNRELLRKTRSGSVRDANALNRKAIKDAAAMRGRAASPDSVVAHLPFGFWAHLTDRAHERVLWIPYLQRVWPRGTNRAELDAQIRLINECRNRIAHHERLFQPSKAELEPIAIDRIVIDLLYQLAPEGSWLLSDGETRVERFLRERPLDAVISADRSKAPSTQEEAIRDYFAMWVTRDFSRFDELFSSRCRYEECYGPIYEGTEELHRWIGHMLAIQHVVAWDIHDMVFAADKRSVTVAWTFVATERESYTFDGCSLIHFDEQGRIDSIREFGAKHERRFPQRRKGRAG
ncbi:nuclear transport factor 2 family protein [Slackia piriformis]|uniref:nuclear transport factor 2 family protein n=1 Tax=Slackia piriformis TaxID=626934 RepID=UPI0026DACFE4|nr:nuclear transport factor 2 family protein [Slackia piriformis]MDO5024714.1 nuclear transport factor 2 family protein [Slackia piriformis]